MPFTYYLALANALGCTLLSLAAIMRRRQSIPQWGFAAGMMLLAFRSGCDAWTVQSATIAELEEAQFWSLVTVAMMPAPWLVFSLTYSRGNGREFLARWKWTVAGSLLMPIAVILGWRDQLVLNVLQEHARGPATVEFGPSGVIIHGLVLISMIAITMNLERTYRASVGTMRWRIKFMLLGLAILSSVQFYISSQAVLFHGTTTSLQAIRSVALLVACLCIARSFMRPGQFSIDLHPSHAALYGSITLILAGVYLTVVGVLARFVAFIGGDSAFPLRALVFFLGLVGLAVVLQSDGARLALRIFVSRHFQRPLFDYRTMWQRFAEGMASGTDPVEISKAAVTLLSSSFERHSVALWLAQEQREGVTLAASTSVDLNTAEPPAASTGAIVGMLSYFASHPEPIDIETANVPGVALLRTMHAQQFPHGGHRLCVPLVARGQVTGFITLGDRVRGLPFAQHDLDMFRCIGDHVAAALLAVRLSQRLAQTRQFEAFQSMATFFVHDLKNAANTLSLLLQNLPDHFEDPEFRDDAIRSCARTVDHINSLIEKLGSLRGGLTITRQPTDLTQLILGVVKDWPASAGVALEHTLQATAPIHVDPEQLTKVVTNLVINAREATSAGGVVRVTTQERDRSVHLIVTDTGTGMSPEFIRNALFKPFQTTKKRGLGIGMFHSTMIVEAHGGRIDVRSEPGKGTTFEVVLPAG